MVEDILRLPVSCYTDLFSRGGTSNCEPEIQELVTARGRSFGITAGGASAETVLSNYSSDVPYVIPVEGQWGPMRLRRKPRSPYDILFPPSSILPEIEPVWTEIESEPSYAAAMRRADAAIRLLSNGSYRGASYWDVALSTAAAAEGYDPEEIALYLGLDVSVVEGYVIRHSVAELTQLELRNLAASKRRLSGANGYVVPVKSRGGRIRRLGMSTVVRKLLRACKVAGVRVYFGSKIVSLSRLRRKRKLLKLRTEDGRAIVARNVVLNIGKPDLVAMGLTSEPLRSGGEEFRRAVDHTTVSGLAKMYCFWEDAWWVTKLNRTKGRFKATGELLQSGRYHDGDVTCRDVSNLTDCRGALLVSYVQGDSYMVGSGLFPHNFNSAPYSPLSSFDNVHRLIPGNMTAYEKLLFDDIHAQLRRVHRASLAARGLGVEAIPEAAGCVYADWRDVGTHEFIGTGLAGVNVYERFSRPVHDLNVSLVNEAWGEVAGWAESSLRSAERALFHQYGLSRPPWMDEPFHTSVIRNFNRG